MDADRRKLLAGAGSALTTSLFTGKIRGANDRIAVAFIGVGRMGNTNMNSAMREPAVQVTALCDVYQPNLERTVAAAVKAGHQPKGVKDFRTILADKSIDAVCISTPDHWHPLMTVEACKAGKDVYVEKPVCTFVDEAPKMVQAARKYNRVVQCGTHNRSAGHIPKIQEVIRNGQLGEITFARVWNYSLEPKEGIGNPPDSTPPPGLDWDLWLGPAPYRPFNQNRFGVQHGVWGAFRYFWDYAGGQLTDNGVHIIDLLQAAFDETAPRVITAQGRKSYLNDNRETPDTTICTYDYPEFLMVYEHRYGNAQSMFGKSSGILIHGSKGTMFFGRAPFYQIFPEQDARTPPANPPNTSALEAPPLRSMSGGGQARPAGADGPGGRGSSGRGEGPAEAPKPSVEETLTQVQTHWANFLECMRTRKRPVGDIEYVARSTVTCLLGNVAYRGKLRVEWDPKTWSSPQREARALMAYKYRPPWKLEV